MSVISLSCVAALRPRSFKAVCSLRTTLQLRPPRMPPSLSPGCNSYSSGPSPRCPSGIGSTKNNLRTVHEDIMKDLFFSFAHPASETRDEPYMDSSDIELLLAALGERVVPSRVQQFLALVDKDRSGTVELSEFLAGHEHFLTLARTEFEAESKLGTEGTVLATGQELEQLIETFGTLDITGSGDLRVDDLEGLLSTTGGHLSRQDAEEIIEVAGSNGRINIHEFVKLCSDPSMKSISWRLRSGFRAIFVIGGPGSGKGRLSERLISCAGIDHVSSGDLLRLEVESGTALGKKCAEIMKAGKLLPSSTVMALLKKSMAKSPGHWVGLDGFPRSAENWNDFEDICGTPHCAFYLDVPDDIMIERILNRGEGRADDNIDTARKRLQTFHEQGKPTLEALENAGVPIHILDATKTPDEVWMQLIDCKTPLTRRILGRRT